jgi:predicted RNA binding protein with dsRBD fold (UPF0201 family)
MKFHLKGRVKIHPTEDLEKVKIAVQQIFTPTKIAVVSKPEATVKILTFESEHITSLSKMQNILKRDMVRDAVRKTLTALSSGNEIKFFLNKQVAYAGHISLCEPSGESPLGPIEVKLRCDDTKRLIDWLSTSGRE